MPQTTCNNCGEPVHISEKNQEEGREVYCSQECSESRLNKTKDKCVLWPVSFGGPSSVGAMGDPFQY